MNIRVQIEGLHLIIIIAMQGGTHSHTTTRTATQRWQRKLGLLAPSLSAGRTPTPPSRPPHRTRSPSLQKIYQYTWYWKRITHPMMQLLGGTGCKKGIRRRTYLAVDSYASNQYFINISFVKFLTHLFRAHCPIPTHISSPYHISSHLTLSSAWTTPSHPCLNGLSWNTTLKPREGRRTPLS
jgi:hypothetical protein